MSIDNIIFYTFKNAKIWNPYKDIGSQHEISNLSIENPSDCRCFVSILFGLSEKNMHRLMLSINNLDDRRIQRIVYSFLIGIHIYEKSKTIRNAIDCKIEKYQKEVSLKNVTAPFSYIWFLICLFHDLGYSQNDGEDLEYNTFNEFVIGKKVKSLRQVSGVPAYFGKVYKNYYNYRTKHHSRNDHGITAGMIMYNDLCKNRKELEENGCNYTYCGKELDKIYNLAGWIILSHNIWHINEDDDPYRAYLYNYLDPLVLKKNEYKIKFKEHPLFFLFCLIDSIEPIKIVKIFSMLKQVYLEANNDKIVIKHELPCGCGNNILKNAEGLNRWLTKTKRINNEVVINLISN